jgi:hypothetical protein
VLSFISSRRYWDSPNPSPAGECAHPPHPVLGGGAHSLAREGLGESQFRRGDVHCGTLYIYVLCDYDYMNCLSCAEEEVQKWSRFWIALLCGNSVKTEVLYFLKIFFKNVFINGRVESCVYL